MKVYSCEQSDWESEHPIWNLRVAASNSFELTKAEEGCISFVMITTKDMQ